jgi:predicted nucleic acid-binding protein
MTCIQTLFSEIEAGKYYALTSSATLIEVLEESERVLDEVMDGRKGEFLDASLPVMSLARDIRKKIRIPVAGGKPRQLDLPDCIHIATAKLYDCECLITVDSKSMLVAQADIDRYFKVKLKQPCEVTDAQLVLQV